MYRITFIREKVDLQVPAGMMDFEIVKIEI